MDWLAHDEVELDTLPAWAAAAADVRRLRGLEVRLAPEGLVLVRSRRASAMRWEDVLVLARPEHARLLVAAARKPPRPPWFEIADRDVDALATAMRARLEAVDQGGYRQPRARPATMSDEQVLAAVLSRAPLPGAVEIAAPAPGVFTSAAVGGAVGAIALSFYGVILGPVGLGVAAGVGALGGGLLVGGLQHRRKRKAGRVLVLTPDGFVGGLDGQAVRAVGWRAVGRFVEGYDPFGVPALVVLDREGGVLARVPERYFAMPLSVIVAVAEAYRVRASPA
ncbi:MAG: hypothetical protein KF729_31415 [Sandaracinaceae bacterium]|nr:hypothetical protein [Sandaracinaceae bacterium]